MRCAICADQYDASIVDGCPKCRQRAIRAQERTASRTGTIATVLVLTLILAALSAFAGCMNALSAASSMQ